MTARPIIFRPELAQKVHDGLKTQTRRLNNLTEINERPDEWKFMGLEGVYAYFNSVVELGKTRRIACPYGVPDDHLWIREAYCVGRPALQNGIGIIPYYGKLKWCPPSMKTKLAYRGKWSESDPPKWRPSIYMPRWACRTVVELTEVRVERLNEISAADAIAEGIFCPEVGYAQHGDKAPILLFGKLWQSINGPNSWNENPWVWVLSFKKVA